MLHFESCISFMGYSQNLTSRLLVYALSIEESTRSRTSRNLKMGRSYEQSQPRFKNKAQNQDGSSAPTVKHQSCSSSQGVKATCYTCRKNLFGKCLAGTKGFFCCGKDVHRRGIVVLLRLEEEKTIKFLQMLLLWCSKEESLLFFPSKDKLR